MAAACDPVGTLGALGKYVVAVLLGLGIHGGVVLPGLFTLATRRWRWSRRRGGRHADGGGGVRGGGVGGGGVWGGGSGGGGGGVRGGRVGGGVGGLTAFGVVKAGAPALVTAFATDSSSAALPVTRRCARAMGVPDALADFSLPLGATVNMNGTALYEAVTVIFIAQLHGVQLGAGQGRGAVENKH